MVRIKNGDEVTGLLDNIDTFMNLKLKDVTYIANGDEVSYWKMTEMFIRGNTIASINLKEGLLEKLEEEKELDEISRKKYKIKEDFKYELLSKTKEKGKEMPELPEIHKFKTRNQTKCNTLAYSLTQNNNTRYKLSLINKSKIISSKLLKNAFISKMLNSE